MRTSLLQKIRAGVVSLFLLTAINIFTGASAAPAQAFHGIGDLLADVPIVDVNEVTDVGSAAGCGVASATMVLDYWMPQSGNVTAALDPKAVLKYIPTHWAYTDNQGKAHYEAGTTLDQLQQGIEKLSADPTFGYGLPLTAKWLTTSSGNWYTALQAEMNANPPRPTILFIPNGHNLGWNWDYGHFIVVSGITSDGNIIYHDPWDGQKHTVSQQAFQSAWGTAWNQNDPWWYLQVQPKGQEGSKGTPTATFTPTSPGTVTEFPLSTVSTGGITTGPDGNLWFTENNAIGRITPSGAITEFPLPTGAGGITTGPDGNLWFTENNANQIGRITPSGSITEFPTTSEPISITTGPDGNLWFTEYHSFNGTNLIGKITPSGSITEFPTTGDPDSIITGPDGNLWFIEDYANKIGKITPSGSITEFPTTGDPSGITTGPDGNLWFTETGSSKIGKITPAGAITEFPLPRANTDPNNIIMGPDGNLWFTEWNPSSYIGRITSTGVTTEFPLLTANAESFGITVGSDGNLWFIESIAPSSGGNYFVSAKIGRITP